MKVAHSMRCFKSLYSVYGASSVDDPMSCGKKMAIATLMIQKKKIQKNSKCAILYLYTVLSTYSVLLLNLVFF